MILGILGGLYIIGIIIYSGISVGALNDKYWSLWYLPFLPQLSLWENSVIRETISDTGIIILEVLLSILLLPVTLTLIILIIPVTIIMLFVHLFYRIFRRKK